MIYDLTLLFIHVMDQTKNHKFLEIENFTKSTYSMMMEKIEYHSLLKQLNEEKRLIFDDVMH
jgi:hypothetical protein